MTLGSLLWFAMIWLKYEVTPEPLRYFWWVVWTKVRVVAHGIHRRLVLQGERMRHRCHMLCSPTHMAASFILLPYQCALPVLIMLHGQNRA